MPDQKISELSAITAIDNATDVLPIVDTSATTTKKITLTQVKTSLALNNVDNTSDANKPISSATQTALDAKQATLVSGTNIKTVNNTSLLGSGNISISSAVAWGGVTGTLSNQTDLQTALDGKVDENTPITGATKTKVTYDSKGLVTAGADATTADIADSTNRRYVTDAQLVVVGNTSGTNTGDNAVNSLYSGLATSKQDTLVSGTNIKTLNSTSLLGSGDIVLTANPSGVAGAIQFSNGSAFASDASNFFWDNTNKRLGVSTNAPSATGHFKGSGITSATSALLIQNSAGTELLRVRDDGFLLLGETVTYGKSFIASANINFAGILFGNNFYSQSDGSTYIGAQTAPSARLQIKGSGSTSATTSLLVQNSAGASALTVRDDLATVFGGGILSTSGALQVFNGTIYNNSTDRNNFGGAISVNTFACIGAQRNAAASAVLELVSTTKGFLPPVMTTTQKNAIATPAAGLVVYDSTLAKLCVYTTTWETITSL